MDKDLPNIFKGFVNDSNNQNESRLGEEKVESINSNDVDKQIKDIFSSSDYLYKANVLITLNDGSNMKKTIIGRSNSSLITIDDEVINVRDISRIELI